MRSASSNSGSVSYSVCSCVGQQLPSRKCRVLSASRSLRSHKKYCFCVRVKSVKLDVPDMGGHLDFITRRILGTTLISPALHRVEAFQLSQSNLARLRRAFVPAVWSTASPRLTSLLGPLHEVQPQLDVYNLKCA